MCSPSWTLLPPPSPHHPSGSSQCTSPKNPVSRIELYFMMHVNQIIILYTLILHNALWKKVKVLVYQQCPTLCDCIDCSPETPWNSPDKNIAVGSHSLIQGIFPSQGLNSGLLHWRQIFQHLSQQRSRLYFKTQKKLIKWKKIPCVWIWIYLECTYQIYHL